MLWANSQSGAQLALINSGAIRDSLPSAYMPTTSGLRRPANSPAPWDIVQGDVLAALALNNTEYVVNISGPTLWAVSKN
jgi:2',3'-cyclic-nucleotide 2'-phosphodiesterase (5'-nucleotidase family)